MTLRTAYGNRLSIVSRKRLEFYNAAGTLKGKKAIANELKAFANAIVAGTADASIGGGVNGTIPTHPAVFGVFSAFVGSIGFVINGTTVTITGATSTTVSMGLLVDAVNADPTVSPFCGATWGTCNIATGSLAAGNVVTVLGVPFTAVSGTAANNQEFDVSGDSSADAVALAAAIRAYPELCNKVAVDNQTSNVIIGLLPWVPLASVPAKTIVCSNSSVTISNGALAGNNSCVLALREAGAAGNAMAVTPTGGSVTIKQTRTAFANGGGVASSSFYVSL